MKTVLLSIAYFFAGISCLSAQILYGTTFKGGALGDGGSLINYNIALNTVTSLATFEGAQPAYPNNTFLLAADGKLYGTTGAGGHEYGGVLFSIDPVSLTYSRLKDFDINSGINPGVSLIQAKDGKIYGMTTGGGTTDNGGVIFSYDILEKSYAVLKTFNYPDGMNPRGGLMQASNGKLYGMTNAGGMNNTGVIFSFDPVSFTYTKLIDLPVGQANFSIGSLFEAVNGKLYGMVNFGGIDDRGIIFSFDFVNSVYQKLKDFTVTDGWSPNGGFVQGSNNKLYGVTSRGGSTDGGVIFSFDPVSNAYIKLYDFDIDNGRHPGGTLTPGNDGNFYGITPENVAGVIFSFNESTSTYTKLKYFDPVNSVYLRGNLTLAGNGKLYGMAQGSNNFGNVFSFDAASNSFTIIKEFLYSANGQNPAGSLLKAKDGLIYGLTTSGGANDNGIIFSYNPAINNSLRKLADVTIGRAYGSLIQASDGKLYGMTSNGGRGLGAIFSYDPDSSKFTIVKDIYFQSTPPNPRDINSGGLYGAFPYGSLMEGKDKVLYGMASDGGGGYGTIFSFNPNTAYLRSIGIFFESNGAHPRGNLTETNDGKLYGLTYYGGTHEKGVLFSYDLQGFLQGAYTSLGAAFTTLKEFDGISGSFPLGSLTLASDGKLYGMTSKGGSVDAGVIFVYDPATSVYLKLFDFGGINGRAPMGNLMQAANGKLYGTTSSGGSFDKGVIFSVDVTTGTYTKLLDYTGANGANPDIGAAFIEVNACATDTTYYQDKDGDGYGNGHDSLIACVQPAGYVKNNVDCDDNNAAIHSPVIFYRDADKDGFGDAKDPVIACEEPAGYVKNNTDCNDKNAFIHAPVIFYRDADRDGFGDAGNFVSACQYFPPAGYVRNNYDCDDYWKPGISRNEKMVMCRYGIEKCVNVKEIIIYLFLGWKPGPCEAISCNPSETIMCHNGKDECIKTTEVQKKLHEKGEHWKLGSCVNNAYRSGNEPAGIEKTFEPAQYRLYSYPNPFTGSSIIQYELPYDSKVSIKVYDVLGRVVAELVNENKKAGSFNLVFNAGKINKGILFLRMIATSKEKHFEQTIKIILQ